MTWISLLLKDHTLGTQRSLTFPPLRSLIFSKWQQNPTLRL